MAIQELKKTMFEELYSSKEETRKGNNLCPDLKIPESLVLKLDKGITTEELSALKKEGYKILLYKTQLTIHGVFPELDLRVGGYKNVFTNKNLSLGVKWNVVDYEKKTKIYRALAHCGWSIEQNSSSWSAYRMTSLDTKNKETMVNQIATEKVFAKSINTSLFFGDVQCYWGYNIFGDALMFTNISIKAIYEKDLEKVFTNITGRDLNEVCAEVEAKIIADKIESDKIWAEYDRQAKIRKAKVDEVVSPYKDRIKEHLLSDGLVVCSPIVDSELKLSFEYKYFYKESERSRKLKWNSFYEDSILTKEEVKENLNRSICHRNYDKPMVKGILVN